MDTYERLATHDDDLSSGAGAQDDSPRVGLLVLLETEHAYTNVRNEKRKEKVRNDRI